MRQHDLAAVLGLLVDSIRRPDALDATTDGAAISQIVVPSLRGMTPTERVEVYREMFWNRHQSNLAEDYPTLAWVIGGASALQDLAREYLQAHPPGTWDLQRLGAQVPAFVDRHPRWGVPLARDAARLDWAFMEVFDAPDAPPFDPHVLREIPEDAWPHARVELVPALRLLRLEHAVHETRETLSAGSVPSAPASAPTRVAVWRDSACFLRSTTLQPVAFALLEGLARGVPLGLACESACGDSTDPAGTVGDWFQSWVSSGWIRALRPRSDPA